MKKKILMISGIAAGFAVVTTIVLLFIFSSGDCTHAYGAPRVIKPATCTEDGLQTMTCTKCGQINKLVIEHTGHEFDSEEILLTPTCTEEGKKISHCAKCDQMVEEVMEKLPHAFLVNQIIKEPTCTEDGLQSVTCSLCNLTTDETIEKQGHKFPKWETLKLYNCVEDGEKTRTCSVCGFVETKTIPHSENAHDFEYEIIKAATCTEMGQEIQVCIHCGVRGKTRSVYMLEHPYQEVITEPATCKDSIGYRNWVCTVCGHQRYNTPELYWESTPHEYEETVTKAVTCTESGEKKFTCKNCGKSYTETIWSDGHKWVSATCKTPMTCAVCKLTLGSANSGAHVWAAATCTAPKTCTVCGQTSGTATGHATNYGKCKYCGVFQGTRPTIKLPQTPIILYDQGVVCGRILSVSYEWVGNLETDLRIHYRCVADKAPAGGGIRAFIFRLYNANQDEAFYKTEPMDLVGKEKDGYFDIPNKVGVFVRFGPGVESSFFSMSFQ